MKSENSKVCFFYLISFKDKIYLCITASDDPHQSLIPHFEESVEFIHKARNENGKVLIHW